MEVTRSIKELGKDSVALAGGKGASLSEMAKAGIPVPPAFVIMTDVFEKFLESQDLNSEIHATLDGLDFKDVHLVEEAGEKIKALIMEASISQDISRKILASFKRLNSRFVAVRSSATVEDSLSSAWAGQLETYLNTTEDKLLENIKRCWASLFTPRAIFYRHELGLHNQKISVAVIVQKMVESHVSGVAFSAHPVTQSKNQILIEAGFGLGEAIVSGQITPDSYVVEKKPFGILDKNINSQGKALVRGKTGENIWQQLPKKKAESQKLKDREILSLANLVIKIEALYGFPVDVEWAVERGKFYILQSRPITTL